MRTLFVYAILMLCFMTYLAGAETPDEIVKWSAKMAARSSSKTGSKAVIALEAKIAPGWHLYSITQPAGGPVRITILIPAGSPFHQAGNITGPKPHSVFDPNFQMKSEFYEGDVQFRIPVGLVAGGGGSIDVKYQVCSDRLCLPPATQRVPVEVGTTKPRL